MRPNRIPSWALPLCGLALFVALAWGCARWMSLTYDEPCHILSGVAIAREADFRFGPNHPPLVRFWFTLPNLLDGDVSLDTREPAYREGKQLSASRAFLIVNDAMAILHRSRFMVILLAALAGWLTWWWTRRLFGSVAAAAALVLFVFEPNLMAHGSLVTTDAGMTLAFLGTVYFLWRVARHLTAPALAGLAVSFAVAQVSKFSALLLWPAVALVLLWRILDPSPWEAGRGPGTIIGRRRKGLAAAGIMLLLTVAFFAAVWGVYGFRYSIAPDPGLGIDFTEDREFAVNDRKMGRVLDGIRILPEAYVRGGAQLLTWPETRFYFFGELREKPVWYFYPVVLLVKTPSALLLLAAFGLWLAVTRRKRLPPAWPAIGIPPAVFLVSGIASGMSSGVRHLLPLFPFLLMAAGGAAAHLWAKGRRGRVLVLALGLLTAVEFGLSYPDTVASFNLLSGGPRRGDRWVVDTNMDWGQGMLALQRWVDRQGILEINLACHSIVTVSSDEIGFRVHQLPVYPGQPVVDPPRLPGYVALSTSVLRGYTGGELMAAFYKPFREMTPVARIGNGIRVYYVEKPWW